MSHKRRSERDSQFPVSDSIVGILLFLAFFASTTLFSVLLRTFYTDDHIVQMAPLMIEEARQLMSGHAPLYTWYVGAGGGTPLLPTVHGLLDPFAMVPALLFRDHPEIMINTIVSCIWPFLPREDGSSAGASGRLGGVARGRLRVWILGGTLVLGRMLDCLGSALFFSALGFWRRSQGWQRPRVLRRCCSLKLSVQLPCLGCFAPESLTARFTAVRWCYCSSHACSCATLER